MGCTRCGAARPAPEPRTRHEEVASPELAALLARNRLAYERSLARARDWLDALVVNPAELRRHGIKGKKKLVEQLDAYYRLWKVAAPQEREALLLRARKVVSITYTDGYHDMTSLDDARFKQDATSYLRAAVLMDRLGLDTARYRQEIRRIHPRLNAHMVRRGPHQRRVFHWYYAHFGLEEPFPLAAALQRGLIAARPEPASMNASQMYELTHEVYALYEYGDRLDVDPFTEEEKVYLRAALSFLTKKLMQRQDPDLLAEVLECLHYLRMQDEPAYAEATLFLLQSQNADGSWGNYARRRETYGDLVQQGFELHTTLVAIAALTAVFDLPMPSPPHVVPDAGTPALPKGAK